MNIDCPVRINRLTPLVDENVYGIVIQSGSPEICAVNPDWARTGVTYIGVASKWLPHTPPGHLYETMDGKNVDIEVMETRRVSKYYKGDIFSFRTLKGSVPRGKYFALDRFANDLICRCVAHACLIDGIGLHRIHLPTSYAVCGKYGMMSSPVCTGNLLTLPPSVDYLAQVSEVLECLQTRYDFFHAKLLPTNVMVDSDGKVRLTDLSHATITYNDMRLLNASLIDTLTSSDEHTIHIGKEVRGGWWKLGAEFDITTASILSHVGLPYYRTLDWYIFIVGLLLTEKWHPILTNLQVVVSMWTRNDLPLVIGDCAREMTAECPSIDSVYRIIRRYHISSMIETKIVRGYTVQRMT